ncbi:hypothetical protein RHGRI_020500 [Rhododendron griersonianum]|uniref:Zinc knuckle CX2CX4HX4C domain-containing protein n=1 Tax=Rhododendron griersonianum TaxID=479676 RepID=A0AAV6JJW9_9ERIC|nr:hypothetical protein RHGRI_020500 [Rhododendron griersonianum]
MVMDGWLDYDALEDIRVREYSLWVRLYNLPFEAFTRATGDVLGEVFGGCLTVDVDEVFPRNFGYLRPRIVVTLDSTLVGGFYLNIPHGSHRWIDCQYERVYKFCRACGRVGHTYPNCEMTAAEARLHFDNFIGGLCSRLGAPRRRDES